MIGRHTSSLILQNDTNAIYLVTGTRNGESSWCYVSVPHAKAGVFLQSLVGANVDVARFGTVLFSGGGTEPPEEVVGIVQRYYSGQ